MNGLIVINKPGGITSHGVVQEIRRLIPGVKAGHTGTLDPMASGVLPVCLGKATRLAEYTNSLPKTYCAGITFGRATETGDADGEITATSEVPVLKLEKLKKIALKFTGRIEQMPPAYSAIKYHGKPAYYWARRGKNIPLRSRTVEIYELKILSINQLEPPHLTVEVCCSAGAYIRSLAVDIGLELKTCAHLSSLKRLAAGGFSLAEARSLEETALLAEQKDFDRLLLPMDRAVEHLKAVRLNPEQITDLQHGRLVRMGKKEFTEIAAGGLPVRIYDRDGNFKAVASFVDNDAGDDTVILKTEKFFSL
ncbi:MAG TPA: tRNA pseudouridine(55) synthase TruB [Firmicutes bacterium]|nr:tRNA pseudouridine(55) synthase TruB [Bacillota bacterium]